MPDSVRQQYFRRGRRIVISLLTLGVILLAVAISAAAITLGSITDNTDEVEQTLRRQASIDRLSTFNEQIATGRRGFLLQPDPDFARVVREASSDYETEQAHLQEILAGSPEQRQRLQEIRKLNGERIVIIDEMFSDTDRSLEDSRKLNFDEDRGVQITQEIRQLAEQMSEVEKKDLVQRNRNQLESLILFYIVGGIALAVLVAVLVAAILLVMRYNRDLAQAQARLRLANEGLEEAVANRTAELSRANREIQRFAYIVSHDLRSPLVNVLGFTSELDEARKVIHAHLETLYDNNPELRDEAAWVAVDEDVPESLEFIRTSTEKMDRLINSILELSRQGRRTIAPELLDMDELVNGIITSLYQRAEDAGAEIETKPIPDIESDRITVEQILQNLVENALKYLSPNRPGKVMIEGKSEGGLVHIDVIDNGRGIAPEDHDRIFDLFRRAGLQDQEGEGIGLATVRALAYRLGGTIEVDSELDCGARFRLSLPRKFVAREALT